MRFLHLQEELEPMPEIADQYIGEEILLQRGDQRVRGYVVIYKCGAEENIMRRAHAYTILDNRVYQVAFPGGKVAELTTNIIA